MVPGTGNKESIIAKLIEWSINNKVMVIILTTALIFAGIWAVANTPIDALPDLSDVQVIILTEYPGQGPRIVEDRD
jgi:Cu(I)/Ag(I) efflux system membrane protein CusA/SilA